MYKQNSKHVIVLEIYESMITLKALRAQMRLSWASSAHILGALPFLLTSVAACLAVGSALGKTDHVHGSAHTGNHVGV